MGSLSRTITVLRTRVRPSAFRVLRWRWVQPMALRMSVTFNMVASLITLPANFFQGFPTQSGDVLGHAQGAQRLHRGLDHIVGVVRADAFGQHVAHAGELDDGAYA